VVDADKFDGGIAVVGCGAIGSRVAHLLCDMGFGEKLCLYDPDVVEMHNLASATYELSDIRTSSPYPKVAALRYQLERKWGEPIRYSNTMRITRRGQCGHKTVFTCLDSMAERKKVMGTALFLDGHAKWVYDARITATTIFAIGYDITDPKQHRHYMEELYDDPDPAQDAQMGGCNQKTSVASTAAIAASLVVQLFMNHVNKVDGPNEIVVSLRDWTMDARFYEKTPE